MGYTHYYTQKKNFSDDEFKQLHTAAIDIVLQAEVDGIHICNGRGEHLTTMELNENYIALNGCGDDLGHETFSIDKTKDGDGFNFCKTARKPYDAVVTSILKYLYFNLPDHFEIGSDGDMDAIIAGPYYPTPDDYETEIDNDEENE
jgi:hypothetical protein